MEKKFISANEINKYTYCPYQWYYQKIYGNKELMKLYKERDLGKGKVVKTSKTNKTNYVQGNFKKGLNYHEQNYRQLKLRRKRLKVLTISILFVIVLVYVVLKYVGLT